MFVSYTDTIWTPSRKKEEFQKIYDAVYTHLQKLWIFHAYCQEIIGALPFEYFSRDEVSEDRGNHHKPEMAEKIFIMRILLVNPLIYERVRRLELAV